MTELWTGARRLPYFYTLKTDAFGLGRGAIVCPQCALEYIGTPELQAQYTTLRSLMCVRCAILLGPINDEEAESE